MEYTENRQVERSARQAGASELNMTLNHAALKH
jgi:hypothetical protein